MIPLLIFSLISFDTLFYYPSYTCDGTNYIPSGYFRYVDKYIRLSDCYYDEWNGSTNCKGNIDITGIDVYQECFFSFSQLITEDQTYFDLCYVYVYPICVNDMKITDSIYIDCYDENTYKQATLEYSDICNVLPNLISKGGKNVQKNSKGASGYGRLSGHK